MQTSHRPRLQLCYIAAIVFGAIVTHLVSEFAGMGSAADGVVFSIRHVYLGLAAGACAWLAVREMLRLRASSGSWLDFKRAISTVTSSARLRGWRFYLVTAGLQCAVAIASAVGEGCFFCGHDVLAALIGALCSALLLALGVCALAVRLPSLAIAMMRFVGTAAAVCGKTWSAAQNTAVVYKRFHWFEALFNRPPPAFQRA
ncbi:MAG: hypothetical protein M3Z37_04865 [Candidatus Eremiobacteraeota bacterium]|nr:hypothetical protein [Candidatus Eremiobacteraeota bacterium]